MAKILIVEDEAGTRQIYEDVLKKEGYEVDAAEDGEAGFNKIKAGGYSVILLDIMLPKKDGLTILTELKKSPPQAQNGPIILLTNLSHDPVIKQALELGAKEAITKSDINPGQLVEKIKKLVN